MLVGFIWLLVYQCIGEILVRGIGLPVPGPVVGMVLLFATLLLRKGPAEPLRTTANGLLSHLSLLFVPAGVGVMLHFRRIADEWPAIVASLAISTVVAIGVTALVMRALLPPQRPDTASERR